MATDTALTDIQHVTPQGLLHAQRIPPKEDVTGAWKKSHEVSDDRTRLPDYLRYDDAKIEDEVDVDYEEIDGEELEDGEEESIQDQKNDAGFINLRSPEPEAKASGGTFTDFEQVNAAYSATQTFSDAVQNEEPLALSESVYKSGGTLGKWETNARSHVDASTHRGHQPQARGGRPAQGARPQAQRLAGDFVNNLHDFTQERRSTQVVSYSPYIGKPQYEFKHARGCTPGILKPSVVQPPSDETLESTVTETDWDTVRSED